MRRGVIVVGLAVFCLGLAVTAAAQHPWFWDDEHKPKKLPRVELAWGVKIPLRDGVKLQAAIYKPANAFKPLPAIVSISPYLSDSYHERAMYFAEHGYLFVLVDSRGRGNSEGDWEPFVHEGKDGYDVVEWVAQQDWCNGKVGMWGGSYGGFIQWATAKELPPHLKTIVPVSSAYPAVDFPAPQGIFNAYFLRWLTFASGRHNNTKLFEDESFWLAKLRERYLLHRPFRDLDQIVGVPNKHFQTWLQHRQPDCYWDATVPSAEQYKKIDIPILTITGQYDDDQAGALEFYRRHMTYGSGRGKERHDVIIGPWDHAGTRKPQTEFGGLSFSKTSYLDMNLLHKGWYDYALKGAAKPVHISHRFIYYVAGLELWSHADALQDIPSTPRKLYLHSAGQANDVFHSGTLERTPPEKSGPDEYSYDPRDTRPAELEKEKVEDYLTDQRYVLNLFGNGLVYHSQPLEKPTEISGFMKFTAWIKLDVPDTDFLVHVFEIQPDGTSVFLAQDRLRARYRRSFREEKLVEPGKTELYEFTHFPFISRVLHKGSRLRVLFHCPNSTVLEKNYNSGGPVEAETLRDARTAHVTLYHDRDHPSCLEIPVVDLD